MSKSVLHNDVNNNNITSINLISNNTSMTNLNVNNTIANTTSMTNLNVASSLYSLGQSIVAMPLAIIYMNNATGNYTSGNYILNASSGIFGGATTGSRNATNYIEILADYSLKALVAGYYEVSFVRFILNGNTSGPSQLGFCLNGSNGLFLGNMVTCNCTAQSYFNVTSIFLLNAGDYVNPMYYNGNTSISIQGGLYGYFSMRVI